MSVSKDYKNFPNQYVNAITADLDNNYFTPVLDDLVSAIRNVDVACDVGCGNGIFSINLKRRFGCKLIGIDGSSHALSMAQGQGFDELHCVTDFCTDPFPLAEQSVDLVLCKDVLEHLVDPFFAVAQIYRILKPGGFCLIHVPNHFPLMGRMRILFQNKIDTFNYFPDANRWDYPHVRFFNKESVIKLAGLNKLKKVDDFSWRFLTPRIVGNISKTAAKRIGNYYTDLFSEGITVLFKK
jgi:SAM-dependent methyltransferase